MTFAGVSSEPRDRFELKSPANRTGRPSGFTAFAPSTSRVVSPVRRFDSVEPLPDVRCALVAMNRSPVVACCSSAHTA